MKYKLIALVILFSLLTIPNILAVWTDFYDCGDTNVSCTGGYIEGYGTCYWWYYGYHYDGDWDTYVYCLAQYESVYVNFTWSNIPINFTPYELKYNIKLRHAGGTLIEIYNYTSDSWTGIFSMGWDTYPFEGVKSGSFILTSDFFRNRTMRYRLYPYATGTEYGYRLYEANFSLSYTACGDNICEGEETWENCCQDCGAPQGLACVNNELRLGGIFRTLLPFFIIFTILAIFKFSAEKFLSIKFPEYREWSLEASVDAMWVIIGVIITIIITLTLLSMVFGVL